MFFTTKKEDYAKAIEKTKAFNLRADQAVDPVATKITTSKYTALIYALVALFAFSAGFATSQVWF